MTYPIKSPDAHGPLALCEDSDTPKKSFCPHRSLSTPIRSRSRRIEVAESKWVGGIGYNTKSILKSGHGSRVTPCKVAYMDLQGIIPWRSCDFQYWIYHILRLVIITAQIVEIAGFVILES
ncbi:hypothetical protein ACN38_g314 [Penicillium nordicum]|uniref:Uncharacterized protein n=1 Tax=Penicillium nordicum TaxID=229535 RepID=A0A0M9WKX6_9EURO|nr:hypothetical protein ACN38_g314 [Penicillium nordicum]